MFPQAGRRTLTPYRATGANRGEPHHLTGYVTTVTGHQDPHDELVVLNGVDEEAVAALSRQQALRPEEL